jgi:hypothetical protein
VKFITENELRDEYASAPFDVYAPRDGTRLTPGARQFLIDRGVFNYESDARAGRADRVACARPAGRADTAGADRIAGAILTLAAARCLRAALEWRDGADTGAAGAGAAEITARLFAIRAGIEGLAAGSGAASAIALTPCTGVKEADFARPLRDCFSLSEGRVQGESGRRIAGLHALRAELRLLEAFLPDDGAAASARAGLCRAANALSQMICTACGNTVCNYEVPSGDRAGGFVIPSGVRRDGG